MKNKSVINISIIIAILFSIIYILFAAKPLAKEYQFNPKWKISTSNPAISTNPDNKDLFYFHLGQTLGYYTEDGNITLYKTFPSKVSISDEYFAIYDANAEQTVFYNPDGSEAGIINQSGYPYFKGNLIYVFLPGGGSFSKCDSKGNVLWTYEGTIPLTAFSAKEKYTAAGFADGSIKIFNNETGTDESTFTPGGSDYPVILGIDISDDGQYIASISGHNQQRFVLSHREVNQQKIIFHTFLDADTPYQTIVHFCKNDNKILYNNQNNLGIYDISSGKNTKIKLSSKLIDIEESEDFVYLLGKEKNNYTVSLIEKTDTLAGSFTFTAETAFINANGNNLYIGKDNSISCLEITKE